VFTKFVGWDGTSTTSTTFPVDTSIPIAPDKPLVPKRRTEPLLVRPRIDSPGSALYRPPTSACGIPSPSRAHLAEDKSLSSSSISGDATNTRVLKTGYLALTTHLPPETGCLAPGSAQHGYRTMKTSTASWLSTTKPWRSYRAWARLPCKTFSRNGRPPWPAPSCRRKTSDPIPLP